MKATSLVTESIRVADEVLASCAARLAERGLVATKEISSTGGHAELSVYFNRGTTVVDLIQTELIRDGEQLGTSADVRHWLTESIEDVLEESSPPA